MRGLLCTIPTVAYPLRVLPSGRGSDSVTGVCDLNLGEKEIVVSLSPEWLAKYSEASETAKTKGFFMRRAYKVQDSRVNWLREKVGNGMSIPYAEVGKVVGKKRKGGPSVRKQGNLVEYDVRFDFNKGEHFWSESYVEFMLTAGEYAEIRGCLVANAALAGRADFLES